MLRIPRETMEAKLAEYDPFLQALIKILIDNLRNVRQAYVKRPRQPMVRVAATAARVSTLYHKRMTRVTAMAARRVAFRAFWGRQRRLTMSRIAGATLPAQKTRKDDHTYHPFMKEGTGRRKGLLSQRGACETAADRA